MRRPSARRRAIYRRRRIVVGTGLVLALALLVFCGYSLVRMGMATASAIDMAVRHDEIYALDRDEPPAAPQSSTVPACSSADLTFTLTADPSTVPVGGTVKLSAVTAYTGVAARGCLLGSFADTRVVTVRSGDQVVWRSDVCPVDSDRLLMARGDKETLQIAWDTRSNATRTSCSDEGKWPRVGAGAYTATLGLKDDPKNVSDAVPILVQ